MSLNIDLHCHSIHSDGTWSVESLLREAELRKIQGYAITDHDTLDGSVEAFHLNKEKNIFQGKLLAGVEISTHVKGLEIHIIALFSSLDALTLDTEIVKSLDRMQKDRIRRMKKMVEKVNNLGMKITYQEVVSKAQEIRISKSQRETKTSVDFESILARPHIARLIVEKGYVESTEEAFELYLGDGKSCYEPKFSLECNEWIRLIKKYGGLSIWAHPTMGSSQNWDTWKKVAPLLLEYGIHGYEKFKLIEGVEQPPEIIKAKEYVEEVFNSENLFISVGSDFHGDRGILGETLLSIEEWQRILKFFSDK